MAKTKATSKKRNVRVDAIGQLHVHSSFNNIIVSLANNAKVNVKWVAADKCETEEGGRNEAPARPGRCPADAAS